MRAVPPVCALIVAIYVAARMRRTLPADRFALARRLGALAVTAWIGEDTVVRAYGFYAYSSHLGPVLDRVPVLVALIWSVVIDSAWLLSERLLVAPSGAAPPASRTRLAFAAGGIVLADASLVEPVAVRAGLWWWTQPGLFAVPPIGILGWALFTAASVWVGSRASVGAPAAWLRTFLLPPVLTHVALVALWWVAFRWVSTPIPAWAGAVAVWPVALALAAASLRRGLRRRVPRAEMLVRVPGALFFYALLAIFGRGDPALVVYCTAFAWPYLSVVDFGPTGKRTVASSQMLG